MYLSANATGVYGGYAATLSGGGGGAPPSGTDTPPSSTDSIAPSGVPSGTLMAELVALVVQAPHWRGMRLSLAVAGPQTRMVSLN